MHVFDLHANIEISLVVVVFVTLFTHEQMHRFVVHLFRYSDVQFLQQVQTYIQGFLRKL